MECNKYDTIRYDLVKAVAIIWRKITHMSLREKGLNYPISIENATVAFRVFFCTGMSIDVTMFLEIQFRVLYKFDYCFLTHYESNNYLSNDPFIFGSIRSVIVV